MLHVAIAPAPFSVALLSLILGGIAPQGFASDLSRSPISVCLDGSIVWSTNPAVSDSAHSPAAASHRWSFGLPKSTPMRRGWEEEQVPISRTQWETNGIRYTQIVLVSRLEPGELTTGSKLPGDSVMLVQVVGENTASEYREATAALSIDPAGRTREIELRDEQVFDVSNEHALPLAVVEIAPAAIAVARGPALRFHGQMPPGTSGSMTIKIPLDPLGGAEALRRLHDLDFDEEFRRVKRFWTERIRAGHRDALPLRFTPEKVEP